MTDSCKTTSEIETRANVVFERTYRASVEEIWELWTTKDGFESWWGPEQFRADVSLIEPRKGGALHYEMAADTPEMVEAMKQMGRPPSHHTRAHFSEFQPHDRLVLRHIIDFLPGVHPYESTIIAEFFAAGDNVRMVVTVEPMHDDEFTKMSVMGFTSQLTKLDKRFEQKA